MTHTQRIEIWELRLESWELGDCVAASVTHVHYTEYTHTERDCKKVVLLLCHTINMLTQSSVHCVHCGSVVQSTDYRLYRVQTTDYRLQTVQTTDKLTQSVSVVYTVCTLVSLVCNTSSVSHTVLVYTHREYRVQTLYYCVCSTRQQHSTREGHWIAASSGNKHCTVYTEYRVTDYKVYTVDSTHTSVHRESRFFFWNNFRPFFFSPDNFKMGDLLLLCLVLP